MWQPIVDCDKQLTIHSRLRENSNGSFKFYDIIAVEFDQYHLHLINITDRLGEELSQILNCKQLIEYKFEVEVKS